jgi:3-hydroxyisobutyrate dehydrogenase-like beta-hydroxyacid dehydrogenase
MTRPVVGFVGFGEAARCFIRHLAGQGVSEMLVFCAGRTNHPPYTDAFRIMVKEHGATLVDSQAELVQRSDVVFSAVVVTTAAEVGACIAEQLRPGALVVDVNASTPSTKRAVARSVTARGGSYVDANLMGAVSLYGAAVPLYCSGDGAERFATTFAPLGLSIECAGPVAGDAAAVKMLRSVVTKGIEALVVEALTAASLAGVREAAMRGICDPMDATTFSKFVDMCIRTDVLHAERRAVEMDGVAQGLRELGLDPIMTAAITARLQASAGLALRERFANGPAYTADEVLDAYTAATRPSLPV